MFTVLVNTELSTSGSELNAQGASGSFSVLKVKHCVSPVLTLSLLLIVT